MLAIDTSLVVRYLVADDPAQARRARALIDGNDVFVSTTAMLETEWVLRSAYGFPADRCAEALASFAGLPRVNLEAPAVVAKALGWARRGSDFADALHLAKADGCDAFVSFDRAFVKAASTLADVKVRLP